MENEVGLITAAIHGPQNVRKTMPFKDLSEFFNPNLPLPVNGKTYTVTAPNVPDGIALHRCFDPTATATTEDQLHAMMKLLGAHPVDDGTDTPDFEGGLLTEMIDDGLSWAEVYRVGQTALLYFGTSADLAEAYWHKHNKPIDTEADTDTEDDAA